MYVKLNKRLSKKKKVTDKGALRAHSRLPQAKAFHFFAPFVAFYDQQGMLGAYSS